MQCRRQRSALAATASSTSLVVMAILFISSMNWVAAFGARVSWYFPYSYTRMILYKVSIGAYSCYTISRRTQSESSIIISECDTNSSLHLNYIVFWVALSIAFFFHFHAVQNVTNQRLLLFIESRKDRNKYLVCISVILTLGWVKRPHRGREAKKDHTWPKFGTTINSWMRDI